MMIGADEPRSRFLTAGGALLLLTTPLLSAAAISGFFLSLLLKFHTFYIKQARERQREELVNFKGVNN